MAQVRISLDSIRSSQFEVRGRAGKLLGVSFKRMYVKRVVVLPNILQDCTIDMYVCTITWVSIFPRDVRIVIISSRSSAAWPLGLYYCSGSMEKAYFVFLFLLALNESFRAIQPWSPIAKHCNLYHVSLKKIIGRFAMIVVFDAQTRSGGATYAGKS